MFSHIFLGVSDFKRALAFYRAVLSPLDLKERFCDPSRPWAGWQSALAERPLFLIGTPYDGHAHQAGNGQMVAFLAPSRAVVDEVFTIALGSGGMSEGEPRLRPEYHPDYYGAYFRDTEGNKICVACHSPLNADCPIAVDPNVKAKLLIQRQRGYPYTDCEPLPFFC